MGKVVQEEMATAMEAEKVNREIFNLFAALAKDGQWPILFQVKFL
jgi:hypothetical protein